MPGPTVRHLQLFQNKIKKIPGGGMKGTLGIDRAITQNYSESQTSSQTKLWQSGQQNRATCFATLLQKRVEIKGDVTRFSVPSRNSTTLYFLQQVSKVICSNLICCETGFICEW